MHSDNMGLRRRTTLEHDRLVGMGPPLWKSAGRSRAELKPVLPCYLALPLKGFLFTNMYDIHICIYIYVCVKLSEKMGYERGGRGLKTQGEGDKQKKKHWTFPCIGRI